MAETEPEGSAGSVDVLICDDLPAMRLLLTVVVSMRPGLRVVGEAGDGQEGIAQAERLQPDVILLDMSMPVLTGLDALPELRRVAPNAKVLAISGFSASIVEDDVVAHGAHRYLEKGAHPDTIAAAIEALAAI